MKRKSRYQTLIRVGLCLLLSFGLFSCGITSLRTSEKSYLEYARFYLEDLEYFYSQEESSYIVYLFSDSCRYCNNIKGNLFDHLDELDESGNGIACYIYNMYSNTTEPGRYNRAYFKEKETNYNQDQLINEMKTNKPSEISETYFFATPSLYLIENNRFSNIYIGDVECANYLDSH